MSAAATIHAFGEFQLDTAGHQLRRAGVAIALEPKAFDLLVQLVTCPGVLHGRDQLLDAVWGHRHVTPGVLSRSIAQLRRALGDTADHPRYIQTVHALGYRFMAPVEAIEDPPPASPAGPAIGRDGSEIILAAADASPRAPAASVAILPFKDLSAAKDQDYFCDGLAEEILTALSRVPGLQVASRTSSFRFRDSDADARDIGRTLNVAAIMEGGVRKADQRVRVTAQLVDAGNGYHLWSENFDRELKDIFAIQEEIARSVVQALRVSLTATARIDLQRYAPRDIRAYEFYLRGRQLERHTTRVAWQQAPQMFRLAIARDPDYAQAHAGLADALIELLLWRLARREDVLDEALAASRRAMALAPELAEAHIAHGHVLSLAGDNAAAADAFQRALGLDPHLYEAHYYYGRHCFVCGQVGRAIELLESAHATRPDEFQALALAAGMAFGTGHPDRGRDLARRALQAALRQIDIDPENVRAYYFAAIMQLHLGATEAGRSNVETALAMRPDDYGTLYNAACFHALAGEHERALDLLERAANTGEGFPDWIEQDSDFDSLRELPRYRALLARLADPAAPP